MNERTTLSISLCITDDKDIERIKNIYKENNVSHKDIYLMGIAQIEAVSK